MEPAVIFSHIRNSWRLATQAGTEVYDLSMLNPDISPPRFLLDKLLEASFKPFNHRYAVSRGIGKLREAFCHKYDRAFSVQLDPDENVCVCMGTKDALLQALTALYRDSLTTSPHPASQGRPKVLLAKPAYLAHVQLAQMARFDTAFFEVRIDSDQMIADIESILEKDSSIKVLLLNFPHNPTGITVSPQFYRRLSEVVQTRASMGNQLFVLNDFVYGEMQFDGLPGVSLLSESGLAPFAAESYSLSKAYCVPGWRLGALLGSPDLIAAVSQIKSQKDYGIFLPIQVAGAAALTSSQILVLPVVQQYRERCRVIRDGLMTEEQAQHGTDDISDDSSDGWLSSKPKAGGSIWIRLPESIVKELSCGAERSSRHEDSISLRFAQLLCEREGVLVMPGCLFGAEYDTYIRLALVTSTERLRSVADKMKRFGTFIAEEARESVHAVAN